MPVAFQDVNFIPDEVVKARKARKQSKAGIKLGIAVSLFAIILAVGIVAYNQYNNKKLDELRSELETQNARVEDLKQYGEKGFILGYRLNTTAEILNTRLYFSKLIEELRKETPSTISTTNWRYGNGDSLTLSASSYPNYTPIATFQENLQNSESGMFTDTQLKSASLRSDEGSVGFSMTISVDNETLKEKLEDSNE